MGLESAAHIANLVCGFYEYAPPLQLAASPDAIRMATLTPGGLSMLKVQWRRFGYRPYAGRLGLGREWAQNQNGSSLYGLICTW